MSIAWSPTRQRHLYSTLILLSLGVSLLLILNLSRTTVSSVPEPPFEIHANATTHPRQPPTSPNQESLEDDIDSNQDGYPNLVPITPTRLLLKPYGFTLYDRLYLRNGTLFALLPPRDAEGGQRREDYPKLDCILTKGIDMDANDNAPGDAEMQIIPSERASHLLGTHAIPIRGTSFILYDTRQFMDHYYHWWGEIMLGAFRVYAGLEGVLSHPHTNTHTNTNTNTRPKNTKKWTFETQGLSSLKRFILPNVHLDEWRDYSNINGPFLRAAFPSASLQQQDYWEDLKSVSQGTGGDDGEGAGTTWVFERAMIVSRGAAHRDPLASEWHKMISSTLPVPVRQAWFEPVRRAVVAAFVGFVPSLDATGAIVKATEPGAQTRKGGLFSELESEWDESVGSGELRRRSASIPTRFYEETNANAKETAKAKTKRTPDRGKPADPGSSLSDVPPLPDHHSTPGSGPLYDPHLPLVLYISRQGGGRRLLDEAHRGLVDALGEVCAGDGSKSVVGKAGAERRTESESTSESRSESKAESIDKGKNQPRLCNLLVIRMEDWPYRDQLELAARARVMVGLHGNGLTHQLWMSASSGNSSSVSDSSVSSDLEALKEVGSGKARTKRTQSTVIEIFYPKAYIHDYEILARNVGHKHYAIWNDTAITYPPGKWFKGTEAGRREDMHGNHIPVHGPAVAEIVRRTLMGEDHSREEEDVRVRLGI